MRAAAPDWIDVLARRAAGERRRTRELPVSEERGVAEHISRARVLKLGVAGAASLLLAGARVSPASAETRDECLSQCFDRYLRAADRDIKACASLYRDPKSSFRTDTSRDPHGWGRLWYRLRRGGWKFVEDNANEALYQLCERRAVSTMERGFERCEDACRETCPEPGARYPSAATQPACHGTTPPAAPKPTPPPPPDPAEDGCWACNEAKGACCGSCPKDPSHYPCLTVLTDGGVAGSCAEVLASC